jgi:membrane protease YdiL (CAAX protease family)
MNVTAKKAFSGVGLVYTVLSLSITALQLVIAAAGMLFPDQMSFINNVNVQILINSLILYVIGLFVLKIGLDKQKLTAIKLEKHSMSAVQILKAFCMCYAVLIASNIIGTMITTGIGVLKGSPVINPIEEIVTQMSIPVMILFTVICAPIFEELFFRKFLIDRVVRYGEVPAALLSGFMFGLFHGNLSQFPYAFTIGIFFGMLYIRTGKILYPVILHAMVNFFGSVVSVIIINNFSVDLLNALSVPGASIAELLTPENMMSLAVLLLFELFIFILVIIGIILWIFHWKKINFYTRELDVPRGSRCKTVLANPGMIAYMVFWAVMIIYSIFAV